VGRRVWPESDAIVDALTIENLTNPPAEAPIPTIVTTFSWTEHVTFAYYSLRE
jgi:hypothetical protein